jgi:methionyl-tRNA formyltransferase
MGTPDFARASLAALLDMPGQSVAGVFCQPDRAVGRGMKILPCPVKSLALEHGIPVFQPAKMRDGTTIGHLRGLKPDLIVVVAYGRMLPKEILDLPPLGCVNIHASLLPELRGAAPVQWAVARGYERTGVTAMRMAEECDAGDILLAKATPVGEREDADSLRGRLRDMGAALLRETVRAIGDGSVKPVPQEHAKATYAPMLTKEDGIIDLSRPMIELDRLVRAVTPWPGAVWNGLRVHRARPAPQGAPKGPQFLTCGDGRVLELLEVQAPGKRRMGAEEFFRGYKGGL